MDDNNMFVLTWMVIGLFIVGIVHTISDYNTNLNALNHCHTMQNREEIKHE
jgi:uncharacterized membrane protein YraQ (UPF0718 family)